MDHVADPQLSEALSRIVGAVAARVVTRDERILDRMKTPMGAYAKKLAKRVSIGRNTRAYTYAFNAAVNIEGHLRLFQDLLGCKEGAVAPTAVALLEAVGESLPASEIEAVCNLTLDLVATDGNRAASGWELAHRSFPNWPDFGSEQDRQACARAWRNSIKDGRGIVYPLLEEFFAVQKVLDERCPPTEQKPEERAVALRRYSDNAYESILKTCVSRLSMADALALAAVYGAVEQQSRKIARKLSPLPALKMYTACWTTLCLVGNGFPVLHGKVGGDAMDIGPAIIGEVVNRAGISSGRDELNLALGFAVLAMSENFGESTWAAWAMSTRSFKGWPDTFDVRLATGAHLGWMSMAMQVRADAGSLVDTDLRIIESASATLEDLA